MESLLSDKKKQIQWLKGKRSAAAGFLLKDDLKPTANPDECLALLNDAWDPFFSPIEINLNLSYRPS